MAPPAAKPARHARLARAAHKLLISAGASENLVVVRTPPGGARSLASAIDHEDWDLVVGTVAGNDTILVVTRDATSALDLTARLLALVDRPHRAKDVDQQG